MQVSSQGRDGTGRMTTQGGLPRNKNSTAQSKETAPNKLWSASKAHPHQTVSLESPHTTCSAVQPERLLPLWFHEWAGRERQRENDREGGWMGGGGGAKGEPWLMKRLRFAKLWPPPPSLLPPEQSCHSGTLSQSLHCFVRLPPSPLRTHTHTPSHLQTRNQTRSSPTRMPWNGMRWDRVDEVGGLPPLHFHPPPPS